MSQETNSTKTAKLTGLVFFEYTALIICLCIIVLQTTVAQSPSVQTMNQQLTLWDNVYSLAVSGVMIFLFAACFIWRILKHSFTHHFDWFEFGLILFILASVLSCFAASDKRAAISESAILIAPVFMALLLKQILYTRTRVLLLLITITALGVLSAYQCFDQLFSGDEIMISRYEEDPNSFLLPLGIEQGSLNHMMLEHRLYSSGVRGFFTNRNSAGCFFLLAGFAGLALFTSRLRGKGKQENDYIWLLLNGVAVGLIVAALMLTRSKGAIGGLAVGVLILLCYFFYKDWLNKHRKLISISLVLLIIAGSTALVIMGLLGTLPGGNSILVRWQYWCASAEMYAEHPLFGVGPGNFGCFYTAYKSPEALETVSNPHNFILSILTQYGPLGLVGFLLLVFLPLWKATRQKMVHWDLKEESRVSGILIFVSLVGISFVMLVLRPLMLPIPEDVTNLEKSAAFLILNIFPVIILALTVLALSGGNEGREYKRGFLVACLFSAVIAVLLHNLIDFAMFEPGIYISFWVILSCIMTSQVNRNNAPEQMNRILRNVVVVAVFIGLTSYVLFVFLPVLKSTSETAKAQKAINRGQFENAHTLLIAAAEADHLDYSPALQNGDLYVRRYITSKRPEKSWLLSAEENLVKSAMRNKANYKSYENLSEVYLLLAEDSPEDEKNTYLERSLKSAKSAFYLYPGSGRLNFKLAEIAHKLSKDDLALSCYKRAVEIENKFRANFEKLYPDWNGISRLGKENYEKAQKRIQELSR